MDHIINRTFSPGEETGWIQDVCTCGWKSKQYYGWQDNQYSLCKAETTEHIRAASNNKFEPTRK